MNYCSTNNKGVSSTFREAVIKGIADDGGLFIPSFIPKLPTLFFDSIEKYSLQEIALEVAKNFIENEIPNNEIKRIVDKSISFDSPLFKISENISILELFYGPTLAFKDFGARFMANVLSYLVNDENQQVTILVATSGDTGSAVANGFYRVEGINVIILYPSKKISEIQEKQLTTFGENITALEIDGTFDDCQRLVKTAFVDKDITREMKLSSANSINIARLIPQTFYYFKSFADLKYKKRKIVFSVPSGNLGNLTAGLIAKKMGLPVHKFIAASNINDIFPKYLNSSNFEPKTSIKTISNAMDVGNPSNFARIISLYNNDYQKIHKEIYGDSFTDEETILSIQELYSKNKYIIDPHGAIGYLALLNYLKLSIDKDIDGVVLETAHPSKFYDVVNSAININIEIPESVKMIMQKEKKSIPISSNYSEFKELLLRK